MRLSADNLLRSSLVAVTLLLTLAGVHAATVTSGQSGNWSSGSTWIGGVAPSATDSAVIAAGHTVTLSGATSIVTLTINSTATLVNGGFLLTVTGNLTVDGTITGGGGTTISGGGAVVAGTGSIASTGTLTFGAGAKSFSAAANLTIAPPVTITGSINVTNNGTVTSTAATGITGSVAGSTWTNASGSTLNIAGPLMATGTLTANAGGNTVNYNGSGAQTIKSAVYRHLTLSNAGVKTAGGALTLNGNLTIGGSATLHGGTSLTHTFLGNWTVNSTAATPFTFTTASTVNFNTPTNLSSSAINGSTAFVVGFNNLNINNTGGVSANINISASGTLAIGAGVTLAPSNSVVISGTGTLTGSGTARVTRTAATADFASQYTIANKTLTGLTVEYTGNGQTLSNLTYGSAGLGGLTISGSMNTASNTATIGGIFSVSGVFSPSSGTITMNGGSTIVSSGTLTFADLAISAGTAHSTGASFAMTGSLSVGVGGSFTASGGTITFSGSAPATLSPATFAGLTINKGAGSLTMTGPVSVAGTLTLSGGTIGTDIHKLTLAPSGNVVRTNGYVVGNFEKYIGTGPTAATFEIGDATTYAPVDVTFNNVSAAGNLTARTTAGDHPNIATSGLNPSRSVNRYWTLTNGGAAFDSARVKLTFAPGDVDGGSSTANFVAGKYDAPNWTLPQAGIRTATSTEATGVTSFSDFQVGEPWTHTVTATAGTHGTISPPGAVLVTHGADVTFTALPDTGYHVDSLVIDGVSQPPQTTYTFSNVTANHTIKATFAIDKFTITSSYGPNGTLSPSGAVVVNYGSNRLFTATPDTGYHVDSLIVDGVDQGQLTTYRFTNVTADHTIRAVFALNQYTITANAKAHGAIAPAGSVLVDHGSNAAFTITPNAGYHVDTVLVDGVDQGPLTSYTFMNVTSNHTIRASFAINQYTITSSAGPNGSITPAGTMLVPYGSDLVYVITPNTGYHIDSVFTDGTFRGRTDSVLFNNVSADHTVRAVFAIDRFTVQATDGPHGSISPQGNTIVDYGSNLSLTATPAAGYHVDSLIVDGVFMGPLSSITLVNITADHTVRVTFAINQYVIMATAGPNGAITPSGMIGVTSGADQLFVITPNAGYHIDSVFTDDVYRGRNDTVNFNNVSSDHTVRAVFAIDRFTIQATDGPHGTISPSGTLTFDYGSTATFDMTPNAGYHVDSVLVDGVYLGPLVSYTFSPITANHTIRALFAINQYVINASAGPNGTITPSGSVGVTAGADQLFVIAPNTGYHIDSVITDGVYAGRNDTVRFNNVSADHTVRAVFAIDRFTVQATDGPHGTISPSGMLTFDYGSTPTFSVTPNTGYHVDSLYVDGIDQGRLTSYTFAPLNANHTIRAVFAIDQLSIAATAGPNGLISPSGTVGLTFGADQLFTFTPDIGYHVDSVIVDGVFQGRTSTYRFTNVTANHTIQVLFAINRYHILASAGANGRITPNGNTVVDYGSTQSFTIDPSTGYHIDSLIIDSVSIAPALSYTFTNVTADHSIRATFAVTVSSITVVKTIDVNGNNIQDPADLLPLPPGVTSKILLQRNGVPYDSTIMGNGGPTTFTFYITIPGNYTLRDFPETPGWIKTATGPHQVQIASTSVADTALFMNFELVSVSGVNYNDRNRNGSADVGDPGLAGWTIQADGIGATYKTTKVDGHYVLNGLGPGTHTVSEILPTDWVQTDPSTSSYTFTALSGQDQTGFNFGNYDSRMGDSSISGIVFADINNDAMKNDGDFGLKSWKVLLRPLSLPLTVDTAITDNQGYFLFEHVVPGNYLLEHMTKHRWTQTYPPTGLYSVTVDTFGTPVFDRDFGDYRLVTVDTARGVIRDEVIASRADNASLKAFEFRLPASPVLMPGASKAQASGDSLPEGTVISSWDGAVVYELDRPKFFYWFDLGGDLKFGHPCLYVFVDQAANAETLAAQWWPVITLPNQNALEIWNSWDSRVNSPDIVYGGYGTGNTPLAAPLSSQARYDVTAKNTSVAPLSRTALSGKGAILIGGKAESATELATWQHDLDSVRSTLIHGNPPALDSNNVLMANNASLDDLSARIQLAATCDTLYFFFTGHGDGANGGGVVFNDIGGPTGRIPLSYSLMAALFYDSLSLERLYMLIDASNSGLAIDDFMQTRKPYVNLVTSTDANLAAGSGLPADTQSTYTKYWRMTASTAPLSPAVHLNWRLLNTTIRANTPALTAAQNPPDTTNAPLFFASLTSVAFPDVTIGDSAAVSIDVTNYGFIPLDIDSIRITDADFFIAGSQTGSIARNNILPFSLVFRPSTEGNKTATITFYHNGEISTQSIPASGFGILSFDTLKYRTFTPEDLIQRAVRKKPVASKFCATFPNYADWTRTGLVVKFTAPVTISYNDRFSNPPQSGDAGLGRVWVFTGATVPVRTPVTVCGIGSRGKYVQVSDFTWISDNPEDHGQRIKLLPSIPSGQQLLLPMPNPGNMRDAMFQVSDFKTNGLVIGTPMSPPASLQYGWIRLMKATNLSKFFFDRGSMQTEPARPFDIIGVKAFAGEKKNPTARKYSNHLAGELAALHFNIKMSALSMTPVGLGELIYDDSTSGELNGLTIREIADSANNMLTYRWGPPNFYQRFDEVISSINRAFTGPMDTISFGTQLRLRGVKPPDAVQFIRPSGITPTRIEPLGMESEEPEQFALYQNYPNPFNPSTTIEFFLAEPSNVSLKVYNVLGQEIATLLNHESLEYGTQLVEFSGAGLSSGVYFYRIEIETSGDAEEDITPLRHTEIKKMLLMK